jgi:DNA-binding MarR family transcriptional regulator
MPTISPGRATRKVDAALAAQLRLSVLRLARRLRQLDVAAEGVTLSQLSALYVLVAQGPLTLGDLAAAEKVQPPTMTRLVSRMEEDGLVRRLAHATDGRIVVVEPTADGARLVDESRRRRTAELVRRLATLTEAERATLAEAAVLLDRLTEVEL